MMTMMNNIPRKVKRIRKRKVKGIDNEIIGMQIV